MTITQNWEFPHRFFEWFSRFCERKSEWAICSRKRANCSHRSFVMSDLSKSLTVALFKKATGAKRSRSLFCSEGPERFAHSCSLKNCSFVQSDRSDLLFGIIRGKNCKKNIYWVNRSFLSDLLRLLFCHERLEWIANCGSLIWEILS